MGTLSNDPAIGGYHCATVVVEAIAVAALLIRVEIYTTELIVNLVQLIMNVRILLYLLSE